MTPSTSTRSSARGTTRATTRSSSRERNRNRGTDLKDLDHDISVSTVKFLNVIVVENKEDLLHLITNVLRNYSKSKSILKQMRASTKNITCELRGKRVAIALARKVEAAFKKYTPEVVVTKPNDQSYYDITVTFVNDEN